MSEILELVLKMLEETTEWYGRDTFGSIRTENPGYCVFCHASGPNKVGQDLQYFSCSIWPDDGKHRTGCFRVVVRSMIVE